MGLSNIVLHRMDELLAGAVPSDNPLAAIRAACPGVTVSRCDPLDMRDETPYRRSGAYDVFLVDNSQHCWRIVADPSVASAIVIAARD